MKIEAEVVTPESVSVTMHITMTVGEWLALKEQISEGWRYPMSGVVDKIRDMADHVAHYFYEPKTK